MDESALPSASTPLTPFAVPAPASSAASWVHRFWQDVQPTPGRLGATLRILLATILTLLSILILQAPFASIALYFVFIVGRESPAVSLRSAISIFALIAAVAVELGVVIVFDNDPMARVLSLVVVGVLSGMLVVGTTLPTLASTFGFIFATLIALWENHVAANTVVTASLWIIGSVSIPIGWSIAVEYVFASRNPTQLLLEQRRVRWEALISLFTVLAEKAPHAARAEAASRLARLALAGQDGMQQLYNQIVERDLDTSALPTGARVRITLLAQLMDVAAALSSAPYADDPESLRRYAQIAAQARAVIDPPAGHDQPVLEARPGQPLTLLDRVEANLHAIRSMPTGTGASAADKTLIALPAREVPVLIPGALKDRATVAFGLKISLCATICYILYHALDYPGISTCVITVFITGLSTTGAIKQKFLFRLIGAAIGGLIFGLGATSFLFPYMDSITSLVILVSVITVLSAWISLGRQFGYVGLQIAFAFYLVTFEGFSAPTELAPARDRLIGILLALLVMWFVFDQLWPVRTVSAMRHSLAVILRNGAGIFRLPESARHANAFREADALRDQVGKTVANLRTMNDTVEYEFGVDRESHIQKSQTMLRAGLTATALFWNEMALLHSRRDRNLLHDPRLVEMRHQIAAWMNALADAVEKKADIPLTDVKALEASGVCEDPHYREYAHNAIARFAELQAILSSLKPEV